jgi:hypothetical protein
MRSELEDVIIAKVEGRAHLAAITVRYVAKSDREMPHDSFLLSLPLLSALLSKYPEFSSSPPPRKVLNNNLAAVDESSFSIIVVISLICRIGDGERDVFVKI